MAPSIKAGPVPCVLNAQEFIGRDTNEIISALGEPICRVLLFGRGGYSWEEQYIIDDFEISILYDQDKVAKVINIRFPTLIKNLGVAKELIGFSDSGNGHTRAYSVAWINPRKNISEISFLKEVNFIDEGFAEARLTSRK